MGRPAAPTRSDKKSAKPKRPPAAAFLVLLLILFFLGAALLGRQAGRIAGDFVEQALGEGSSVSRVEFAGPARLRIVGFESPGLSADEVVLQLSLTKAFTGGITSALRGIELVGLCVDVERLLASAGGAASGAGLPESDAAGRPGAAPTGSAR